jgi:hypothetical protein
MKPTPDIDPSTITSPSISVIVLGRPALPPETNNADMGTLNRQQTKKHPMITTVAVPSVILPTCTSITEYKTVGRPVMTDHPVRN